MSKIPILLCVDCEPDVHCLGRNQRDPWRGFEECFVYLNQLRPRLEEATGSPVQMSWFIRTDPQIEVVYGSGSWPFEHYTHQLRELAAAGDEIGLHVHPFRWEDDCQHWVCDFKNAEWVEHCTRFAVGAFASAQGHQPVTCRYGNRFMSHALLALLDELGVQVDMTLEPDMIAAVAPPDEHWLGDIPDFIGVPHRPYLPARRNYRRPARWWERKLGNIWVLPLSSGPRPGQGIASNHTAPVDQLTLDLAHFAPTLCQIMDALLTCSGSKYLAIVARSDIGIHAQYRPEFEKNLKHLLTHPLRRQFVFTTPCQAIEMITGSRLRLPANAA